MIASPRRRKGRGILDQRLEECLEERLEDLQICNDKKLISEEEYCKTKQQLLDSCGLSRSVNTFAAMANCSQDPTGPASLMRFGFGFLVSPQIHQKRLHRLHLATMGQTPSPEDSTNTLKSNVQFPIERCRFWCSFITTAESSPELYTNIQYDNSPYTPAGGRYKRKVRRQLSAAIADLQVYDITAGRVQELFHGDDLEKGHMNAEGLKKRLGELNLSVKMRSAERLIEQVQWVGSKSDNTEGDDHLITVEEFDLMLTSLRLAELFTPEAGIFRFKEDGRDRARNKIYVCDYSQGEQPKIVVIPSVEVPMPQPLDWTPEETCEVRVFFFDVQREVDLLKQLGTREHTRWVHVDASESGLDRLTILRLATKYHLHPLAVEDVIDNRTPPKVDDFEDHYFVSMEVITLLASSEGAEVRVQTQRSNASIFLSKAPVCDTLLSIFQDRADESSWLAMWRCNCDAEEEKTVPDVKLWKNLWNDLQKQPPIRVREMKADFLLYEILDRIVNELRPVIEAYSRRLGFMHQSNPWTWSASWLNELSEVDLELTDLARSIRPMRQVVRHFINDDQIGRAAQTYLEDTEDQIDQTLDDLSQLKEMIGTLTKDYEGSQDKSMNLMLFILSIVSGIFLPAQFVTGLYGMNFDDIPELGWTKPVTGYQYFWILVVPSFLFFALLLFCFHYFSGQPLQISSRLRLGCFASFLSGN